MSVIEPTINGTVFEDYSAKVVSYSIGPCDYEHGFIVPEGSMIPVKLKYALGLRQVILVVDFEGEDENDITDSIRMFIGELHDGAEIALPDGYTYTCVYKKSSAPDEKAPWIQQVKFTLQGYRHGSLVSTTLSVSSPRSFSITAQGDYRTPLLITITTTASSISVMGVTIQNISGTIKIDGYKKTVIQGSSTNKFGDTDLTEFPFFEPGSNSVPVQLASGNTATVEISYYPIYR